MNPLRIAGLTCLAVAALLLVLDVFLGLTDPTWQGTSIARLWGIIGPGGLMAVGRFIEGSVSATLWNGVLIPVLSLPTWVGFLVLGMGLVAGSRNRD